MGRENCFAVIRRCFLRTRSVKPFPSRPSFLRRRTSTGFASRRFSRWQSENQKDSRLGRVRMDLMHHWQPCFRTVSAILIVLSTVVAKDAIRSFRVQSDPSTDSLSSISLLGWLKTCPEDLAKHAGAFLLMVAR